MLIIKILHPLLCDGHQHLSRSLLPKGGETPASLTAAPYQIDVPFEGLPECVARFRPNYVINVSENDE